MKKQKFIARITACKGSILVDNLWRDSSAPLKSVKAAEEWLLNKMKINNIARKKYEISITTNCADCEVECGVDFRYGNEYYCADCNKKLNQLDWYGVH